MNGYTPIQHYMLAITFAAIIIVIIILYAIVLAIITKNKRHK